MVKNKFTLVWSFKNRLEVFKRSILTADKTCPKSVNFCLVDGGSDDYMLRELREFCNSIKDRIIRIVETNQANTVCEAWNLGIMLSDTENIIIASSDVEFIKKEWFLVLEEAMKINLEYVLLQTYAVFIFKRNIIPKMGWFDEKFGLGPHFDVDHMIRASESNIKFGILLNHDFYKHGHDEIEVEKNRINIKDDDDKVKDRLPMNNKFNEEYFKNKWKSDWEGWQNWTHPPTHISQVNRNFPEVDPHPMWTKKFI